MELNTTATLILFGLVGAMTGAGIYYAVQRMRLGTFEAIAQDIVQKGQTQAETLKRNAELALKQQQYEQQKELEKTWQSERKKHLNEEDRLKQREDKLEGRLNLAEKKLSEIDRKSADLETIKFRLEEEKRKLEIAQKELLARLEETANLSSQDAKKLLLDNIHNEIKADAARYIKRVKEETEILADTESARVLSIAINRLASSTVSEATVTTISLPSEEMKGRIIGREGRNIRALEKATGVNFIMDDTPQAVVISSFDPVRKHVAKLALLDLVQDGRIHPTRIEEAVDKATQTIKKQIRAFGEDAALRVGLMNLHPELINLLGKLKFRFSLGQNVLDHSLEVAQLMGLMAGELGINAALAKRIGLLHDIGKAVSHEMEGTHAIIGHDLAIKFGETKEVANGIGCHHQEMDPTTIEGSLCSAADAISASRPGARIEAIEEYVKRLKKLEEIAHDFPGVERAHALQAGREVRVIVLPDQVSDEELPLLARNLTKKIENELDYPGKIKVTILREKRVVDYAI